VGGVLHPLTGADHMLAMLMVGLWAGMVAGRAMWVLPLAFLSAMLAGFTYGAIAHTGGMGVEMLIILSLLALGTAVVLKLRAPIALAAGAVGLFGFAHGMAHGLEAPAGQAALGFAGGFLIATALLHGLGLLLARHVPVRWARAIGAVGAGLGLVLASAA
jgi:urease accessory protein